MLLSGAWESEDFPDLCGRDGRDKDLAGKMAGGTEEKAWESGWKACPDGGTGAAAGSDWNGVVSSKYNKVGGGGEEGVKTVALW